MERGQLSRAEFMQQITGLTRDLVEKVRAGMGKEVSGLFRPLEVACPRCSHAGLKESFRCYECPACKLVVWKTMAGRELEREEVEALLLHGKVGPLEGFRSKMGRLFSAAIQMGEKTEWKQGFDFESSQNSETSPIDLSDAPRIAQCPVCRAAQVAETATAYLCEGATSRSCKFRMGKVILEQPISTEQARKLCETGKTDLLRRFISKKKRPFSAFLKLEGDKVTFEFEPRAPKTAAASKTKRAPKKASPKQSAESDS
jgi:DNA topoisomerase-3